MSKTVKAANAHNLQFKTNMISILRYINAQARGCTHSFDKLFYTWGIILIKVRKYISKCFC